MLSTSVVLDRSGSISSGRRFCGVDLIFLWLGFVDAGFIRTAAVNDEWVVGCDFVDARTGFGNIFL